MIEVNDLTKIYRLYNSPKDRLREIFNINGKISHQQIHALTNVTFNVKRGQMLGIVGPNGSGKSTLVKIICGVLNPTNGKVYTNGRIAALLELGAGFNPEFTGRENVYMNGALMGLSSVEVSRRFFDVETFAEIGEFIDRPVKTYSTGMFMRLAFATAISVDPEILVVDEALSVGDALFRSRCFAKFQEFKKNGVTIIFVTHDLNTVTTHCDRALLLDQGNLVINDLPKTVVDEYNRLTASRNKVGITLQTKKDDQVESKQMAMFKEVEWQGLFKVNPHENRYGTKEAEILEAGIFTPDHKAVQILERNQEYLIKVKVRHNKSMPAATVAFTIKNPKGTILCGTNTLFQNINIGYVAKDDVVLVTFRQKININPGEYILSIAAGGFEDGEGKGYDRRFDYMALQIIADEPRGGLFDLESEIDWIRLQ